nr:OmpH family outer membrane protein [uncultured Anaeromusa sp.]
MMKLEKRQIRMISLAIVAFFVLSVVGIAVSQTGSVSHAAAAAGSGSVGVVNYDMLVSQHPDYTVAQKSFEDEVALAKKDFDAKAATMNDKEKQDYYMQIQERLQLKKASLLGSVNDKVTAAVKAVADAKGLAIVIDKGNVVYGGQDITDEVIKKFK